MVLLKIILSISRKDLVIMGSSKYINYFDGRNCL